MASDNQREEFRQRIQDMATSEDYQAIVRDLKDLGNVEETHDLAEEAYMVASARLIV